jgi:hypothetical protein
MNIRAGHRTRVDAAVLLALPVGMPSGVAAPTTLRLGVTAIV